MSAKFQIDGIGINKEHYTGWKKADFVKDIIDSVPDRFGGPDQKKAWAEKAFDLINPELLNPTEVFNVEIEPKKVITKK